MSHALSPPSGKVGGAAGAGADVGVCSLTLLPSDSFFVGASAGNFASSSTAGVLALPREPMYAMTNATESRRETGPEGEMRESPACGRQ